MNYADAKVGMRVYYEPGNNGTISHGIIVKLHPTDKPGPGFLSVTWDALGIRATQPVLASHVEQEE